jgi:hypothetical protein
MSLALWGAMAGGGKAAKDVFAKEQEAQIEQQQKSMDQAREERLLKIKEKYARDREERGYGHDVAMEEKRKATELEVRGAENQFKASESSKKRDFEEEKQIRDIQAEWDRAKLKADTDIATSDSGGSNSRFQSVKIKTSSMTPEGGFEEKEVPIVFDKQSGSYFEDRAGKLIPYDLENNIHPMEQKLLRTGDLQGYLKTRYGQEVGVPKWWELKYGKPQ